MSEAEDPKPDHVPGLTGRPGVTCTYVGSYEDPVFRQGQFKLNLFKFDTGREYFYVIEHRLANGNELLGQLVIDLGSATFLQRALSDALGITPGITKTAEPCACAPLRMSFTS